VQKFRGNRDAESAALLEDVIYAVRVKPTPCTVVADALQPTLLAFAHTHMVVQHSVLRNAKALDVLLSPQVCLLMVFAL
jgi:hypothetical protein